MKSQCTLCDRWFVSDREFLKHLKWQNKERKPGADGNYRYCDMPKFRQKSNGLWTSCEKMDFKGLRVAKLDEISGRSLKECLFASSAPQSTLWLIESDVV